MSDFGLQFDTANKNSVTLAGVNDPFRGLAAFSIVAWIKPSVLITTSHAIVANWVDTTVLLRVNASLIQGFIKTTSGNQYGGSFSLPILSSNVLYHVVFTYDGTILRGYLNAVVGGTTFVTDGNPVRNVVTAPLTFGGANRNSSEGYFDGIEDDIRFYNRALTQAEITNLYNLTDDVLSGLIDRYILNEGSGIIAGDSVGSLNGTLTNNVGGSLPLWVNGLIPTTTSTSTSTTTTSTSSSTTTSTTITIPMKFEIDRKSA